MQDATKASLWGCSPLLAAPILALVTLLLAVDCGGDEEQAGPAKTATATETAEAGKTPASGETNGDVGAELKDLGKEWGNITAKVTYNFSSTSDGKKTETQMTLYSRPPDSRIDYTSDSQGEAIFIDAGGTSYFCSSVGGEGTCFSSPSQADQTSPLPFFGDFADPGSIDQAVGDVLGVDIDHTKDKIAGQDADCFSANGSFTAERGTATWCFAEDGLLLRSAFSGGASGDFTMEAVKVERNVSDSDFEPPYPVTSLGNLPIPTP